MMMMMGILSLRSVGIFKSMEVADNDRRILVTTRILVRMMKSSAETLVFDIRYRSISCRYHRNKYKAINPFAPYATDTGPVDAY